MLELFEGFAKLLFNMIFMPLLDSGIYRQGFCAGMLIALAIGWSSRALLAARGKITVFFADVQPSLKSSPSPYKRMNGCLFGLLTFLLFIVTTLTFLWAFTYFLSR
ncbi:MAG TPA: hypothetical protein PK205_05680 [Promineifilum sp.]|nr:hypothetical protein [Promineifilum sp.]